MEHSTVSSKYQIVIPRKIRKELQIKSGQKVAVFKSGAGFQVVPQIPMSELFGTLTGMDSDIERDEEDRIL